MGHWKYEKKFPALLDQMVQRIMDRGGSYCIKIDQSSILICISSLSLDILIYLLINGMCESIGLKLEKLFERELYF